MRFLPTSDCHLGRTLCGERLPDDYHLESIFVHAWSGSPGPEAPERVPAKRRSLQQGGRPAGVPGAGRVS